MTTPAYGVLLTPYSDDSLSRPQTWQCVSGECFIQRGSSRRESLVVTLQGTRLFSFTVPCAGSLLVVTLQGTRPFSFTVPCAGSLLVRISCRHSLLSA